MVKSFGSIEGLEEGLGSSVWNVKGRRVQTPEPGLIGKSEVMTQEEIANLRAVLRAIAEGQGTGGGQAGGVTGQGDRTAAMMRDLGIKPGSMSPEELAQLLRDTTLASKEAAAASKEAAEASKEAAEKGGGTTINQNQHQRIVTTDKEAQKRNTINGESDSERREVG